MKDIVNVEKERKEEMRRSEEETIKRDFSKIEQKLKNHIY